MINRGIARRYAQALIDLAPREPNKTAGALRAFADLVSAHTGLQKVLSSPGFCMEERKRVAKRILAALAPNSQLERFVGLLIERHRVPYLPAIAEEFQSLVDRSQGTVRVVVDTAVELEQTNLERLRDILSTHLGKRVITEQHIDPALIGGLAVRIGGLVVDGSLKSQFARLKANLSGPRS